MLPGNVLCLTFTNKATEHLQRRIRGALAELQLAEGEEPEIVNYHGFAAKLLDRYGMLAGIEPDQRVLSPAQRTELCARVMDLMTFEYVNTETQGTVIDNILLLDDQASNHRRTPEEIIAFNEDRLEQLKEHRSDRAYQAALERIELAKRSGDLPSTEARPRGDRLRRSDLAGAAGGRGTPAGGTEYRQRFGAVLLDEYQDTNVAQAKLIAGVFGGGHPVTAVGDPDQNIYAWRGASLFNLFDFPQRFPRADDSPCDAASRSTPTSDRVPGSWRRPTWSSQAPRAQRPDPDKKLVPWIENGTGEMHARADLRRVARGGWIAERILQLHEGGETWSDVAVLCRSSRLFFSLQQAFAEREIPAEILGLAGLLRLPEIVEVLAYARAVNDPLASVALARILLGPGTAWVTRTLHGSRAREEEELRAPVGGRGGGRGHAVPVRRGARASGRGRGLSEEARERLEEFRRELADLRVKRASPSGSSLARSSGGPDPVGAGRPRGPGGGGGYQAQPGSVHGQVHAFEPVEGELTLRAFLEYVDTVERMDKPEWAPVQPSAEDSVKVMTIHAAKGLSSKRCSCPAWRRGCFQARGSSTTRPSDAKSMDFELRGDAKILPTYDGVLSHFKAALQAQEEHEERRTAYVALTRARKRLYCTGAHWYGENINAKEGGKFLKELADWVHETRHATFDPGTDIDEETNPLMGYRERFVRDWPEPATPEGRRRAVPGRMAARRGLGCRGRSRPAGAGRRAEAGRPRAVRGAGARATPSRRVPVGTRGSRRCLV